MSYADEAREQGLHPDQDHDRQIEASEAETGLHIGMEEQRQGGLDPTEFLTEEFTETVTEADIGRDLPPDHPAKHNLEEKMGAHLSKQHALGNITREEYETEKVLDRMRRHLVQMNYRRQGGTGSKCTGRTRERMTAGNREEKPLLTTDLDDQLDEAFEIKSINRSGSIGGWLFSKIADIQVVSRSEGFKRDTGDSSGSGGVLSRVTGGLFGG